MDSISKRPKSIDRISNLPDSLISHILSFLSTKDAVRTSVLSTQWIHHWTSITRLDFEDCNSEGTGNNNELSFLNFVNRVLLCKSTRLDSFRLETPNGYDVAHVNSWLSAALSRHVRQIDLSISLDVDYDSPHSWPPLEPRPYGCLFSSRTLVVLKLGMGFLLKVPDIICLESLKIFHLSSVRFEDSESLTKLVSSCPVLEELEMEGELSGSISVLNISSLVLKRLILDGLYSTFDYCPYEVVLNTPSLEYLKHIDAGVPDGYHVEMKTLRCLDRAHLGLFVGSEQSALHGSIPVLVKSMEDLTVAISHVRSLYLQLSAFEDFSLPDTRLPIELPKFHHLTDLKIGGLLLDEDLSFLVAFLQASPQLASLSFRLGDHLQVWDPPTAVPFCMQQNLKVIEVKYFTGSPLELSMIEYFLGKTISLEKLIISVSPKSDLLLIKKQLLKLPKASKSCKVEFP